MSEDLIVGLIIGAIAGAFAVAVTPCGHTNNKQNPGPPPERPHNMLGKPKPYKPVEGDPELITRLY